MGQAAVYLKFPHRRKRGGLIATAAVTEDTTDAMRLREVIIDPPMVLNRHTKRPRQDPARITIFAVWRNW